MRGVAGGSLVHYNTTPQNSFGLKTVPFCRPDTDPVFVYSTKSGLFCCLFARDYLEPRGVLYRSSAIRALTEMRVDAHILCDIAPMPVGVRYER